MTIPVSKVSKLLCAKVSDFIKNGSWHCYTVLITNLVALWSEISAVQLPYSDIDDKLVWLDSLEGTLSLSIAYEFKRSKQVIVPWDRWVWRQCFRPRNSIILWKFLHGKILTDDLLLQRGFSFASMCSLCHASVETCHHLFFECSFSKKVWSAILSLFQVTTHFQDIYAFFSYPLQHGFGTQLQLLWWGMIGAGFYAIWDARNSVRFDECRKLPECLAHSIKLQIREIDTWGLGSMQNSVEELCILSALGVSGRASRPRQVREVIWHTPSAVQVKVNTDGAAHGAPGLAGYGGIFRDHLGNCLSCFAGSMGIATALEAELQAIISAVSMASNRGWNSLWIECDSAIVLHFLANKGGSIPWRLSVAWDDCCNILSSMQIKFSHIYREGNQVADCLANYGLNHNGQFWWDSCPPCASAAFVHNLQGLPNFRFC